MSYIVILMSFTAISPSIGYDPREAVAEFLKRKSRRNSQPDTELFKDREYRRKFYRESSGCL
jgi:hypothetical protein